MEILWSATLLDNFPERVLEDFWNQLFSLLLKLQTSFTNLIYYVIVSTEVIQNLPPTNQIKNKVEIVSKT